MPEALKTYHSFDPEDMKEGSNLWDNADAKITSARFTAEAPDGYKVDGPMPLFAFLAFEIAGTQPLEERQVSQSYSLGASAAEMFTIDESGHGLVPVNDESVLRKDSKFGTLIASLKNNGVPASVTKSGNILSLVGINAHWKRVADKEREFISDRTQSTKKSKFPPSTLVCTKLLAGDQPWGKAATNGSGQALAGAVNPTAAAAAPSGTATASAATGNPGTAAPTGPFDLDATTMEFLLDTLKKRDGKAQRGQLTLWVMQAAMLHPDRQAIAKRAIDETYLGMLNDLGVIKYDPASTPQMVTLGA